MADQLRDLRDDRVAGGSQSVHRSGKPIIHSENVGAGRPRPSLSQIQSVIKARFAAKKAAH